MTDPQIIPISAFTALTLGIVTYFVGAKLTRKIPLLATYSIPESVSGGLFAAIGALGIYLITGREIAYDLAGRDALLVYFFTAVGLNARIGDLLRGGRPLAILLALTVLFMVCQSAVGVIGATLFDYPPPAGIMLGTASLVGGHGTAIAWGPSILTQFNVPGAAEIGVATATLGLVLASLIGGPIAKTLIERNALRSPPELPIDTAAEPDASEPDRVTHVSLMHVILWLHVAIFCGLAVFEALETMHVRVPVFLPCLLCGIALSNLAPRIVRRATSPAGSTTLAVVSEFSLSVFLSMSLMSMELWALSTSFALLFVTIFLQLVLAVAFTVFVVFRSLGRDYFAAVLSAGFAGFALGATPTAIANMTAVTQRYGPSPLAFIVLPLVSAFFADIANAIIIQWTIFLAAG
ncbi:sodium/glutamate symporter [Phaeobacter sp. B1627]|uniref:sodium/glutamate symporter n=1 Tax=Phaeobacter sp. B1627 TaxID=2583809 RepID=UPI00111B78F8|nr:sodium/glutamate symporter [Phaeobacter sp. B1627]TNJ40627.1 sodium/glutamate symporter [Phaeobacter sp. B1627]